MRRAVEEDGDDIPGGDSFLDIVANIVGILVLLVVVVGVRAGRAIIVPETVVSEDTETTEALKMKLSDIVRQAYAEQSEITELADKVASTVDEAGRREAIRESAVLYNTTLRAELDEARKSLNEGDQRSLDSHNAIAQAQLKLDRLTREQVALAAVAPEPDAEIVEVAPTPIVNGEAEELISFRLQKGRLVYVPLNELAKDLSKSIHIPTLIDPAKPVVTRETIGPIEGFVGEAEIGWSIRSAGGRVGPLPVLNMLRLREVTPMRGEEPEQAFSPGGYVSSRIELLDPKFIVIQLYVYADSFDTSAAVANRFRERGFRVAQFLKTDGSPIGVTSNRARGGFSSVTQ
jgi:hypothetical protein